VLRYPPSFERIDIPRSINLIEKYGINVKSRRAAPAWYSHKHFKSDGGNEPESLPQPSYSHQGESARADWLRADGEAMIGNLVLPFGFQLAEQFDASSVRPYNITMGTDNNGDGGF
jgi:hypothetical protein